MEHQILFILLAVYLLGSFALAISYLLYRHCSALEIALWGTLALCVPALGPFFVIAARPGPRKHTLRSDLANRVFPSPKG